MTGYQVDYPGAQGHFLPDEISFPTNAHSAIVIHKTGGDARPKDVYDNFVNCLTLPPGNKNRWKSAHYAIGQDGSIWQFVPEDRGAGANGATDETTETFWQPFLRKHGNLNKCTLSIEHCDPSGNNDTPLTPEQRQASFQLVAHLVRKYSIPTSNIKPHNSICRTGCPGTYPMDDLRRYVQEELDMLQITDPFAATHFTSNQEGDRWHCITADFDVVYGVLKFYRKIGGAPRLPVANEQHNPQLDVIYQVFEAGIIVYDPAHKLEHIPGFDPCYLLKLDSDLAKHLLSH